MRFASYMKDGRPSFGLVTGGGIVDLAHPEPSLKAAIAAGSLQALGREAANARPTLQEDQITFLPVITDPAKVFCVGLNYEDHRRETGREVVGHPTIFTRFANCLAGHDGEIVRPRESDNLDFEGELAVIIGRGGRRIPEAHAWDHIAGYSCFNDASVRDWQNHTHQYTPGKNFMTTGPFGPYLVTPDEVGEIGPQTIQTRLNGEVVQSSSLDHMIFSIPVTLAYLSTFTELEPGDIIAMGTPGGVGAKRTPPLWMKPGDVVEVEIEKVGLLRSRVVAER